MKTALITGASTGIGYELATLFARDGYNLVLVARHETKLTEIAENFRSTFPVSVMIIAEDMSVAGAAVRIFERVQNASIIIDTLVNNAGFGTYGYFTQSDLAEELQMIELNISCLTHLTGLFLKEMMHRGNGRILNVASVAAFQPGPRMAVYYASKAYVLSFSDALSRELRGTGITVTTLCPGPTRTEFQQRAGVQKTNLLKGRNIMDAHTVALCGYRGMINGKALVIPGTFNKLWTIVVRLLPRNMILSIVKTANSQSEQQT